LVTAGFFAFMTFFSNWLKAVLSG